jgi:DNA-binding transcriptional regulator GbsR (MarR family)
MIDKNSMMLSDKQKALIEKIGIYHENNGMQPAVARIMGLLFVSDQPQLTFDEISEALNLSKSATSNALNLLLQTGQIEYTTFSGERKRYFKLKISNWREGFTRKIDQMISFRESLLEAMELKADKNCSSSQSISELIGFLDFLSQEMPNLLDKWESRKH